MKGNVTRRLLALVLCMALFSSIIGSASALEANSKPAGFVSANGAIRFAGLDKLNSEESLTVETFDEEGNPAKISIRAKLPENLEYDGPIGGGGSTTNTWEISYYGVAISARFYIRVTDNVVTNVYDEWVLITGGTFSNLSLEKTNTYGKLSFDVQMYGGIMGSHCWLKATVTGSGNEVTITKMM